MGSSVTYIVISPLPPFLIKSGLFKPFFLYCQESGDKKNDSSSSSASESSGSETSDSDSESSESDSN